MRGTAPTRRFAWVLPVIVLIIGLPTGVMEARNARVSAFPASLSPALDRFLSRSARSIPRDARVVVYGKPEVLVFYRATYLLYPRRVYSAVDISYAHRHRQTAPRWRAVVAFAHRVHADYVLLWAVPLRPPRVPQKAMTPGILVTVRS